MVPRLGVASRAPPGRSHQCHTRSRLLNGLGEKGFDPDQLAEMQRIMDAEDSYLFDVLAHVACALPPVTRRSEQSAHAGACR